MWYVVQVKSGKEQSTCDLVCRMVSPAILQECFVPAFATQKKVHGQWQDYTKVLFPGYVIAVTDAVDDLHRELRSVPEFTRLVPTGEMFVPLDDAEQALISAFTRPGQRTVEMSVGFIEGGQVVITAGPLTGHTGWVERVDRKRSLAMLRVEMFGRTLRTKVGLAVLASRPN